MKAWIRGLVVAVTLVVQGAQAADKMVELRSSIDEMSRLVSGFYGDADIRRQLVQQYNRLRLDVDLAKNTDKIDLQNLIKDVRVTVKLHGQYIESLKKDPAVAERMSYILENFPKASAKLNKMLAEMGKNPKKFVGRPTAKDVKTAIDDLNEMRANLPVWRVDQELRKTVDGRLAQLIEKAERRQYRNVDEIEVELVEIDKLIEQLEATFVAPKMEISDIDQIVDRINKSKGQLPAGRGYEQLAALHESIKERARSGDLTKDEVEKLVVDLEKRTRIFNSQHGVKITEKERAALIARYVKERKSISQAGDMEARSRLLGAYDNLINQAKLEHVSVKQLDALHRDVREQFEQYELAVPLTARLTPEMVQFVALLEVQASTLPSSWRFYRSINEIRNRVQRLAADVKATRIGLEEARERHAQIIQSETELRKQMVSSWTADEKALDEKHFSAVTAASQVLASAKGMTPADVEERAKRAIVELKEDLASLKACHANGFMVGYNPFAKKCETILSTRDIQERSGLEYVGPQTICSSDQIMCNPLLGQVDGDGKVLCVSQQAMSATNSAAEACSALAGPIYSNRLGKIFVEQKNVESFKSMYRSLKAACVGRLEKMAIKMGKPGFQNRDENAFQAECKSLIKTADFVAEAIGVQKYFPIYDTATPAQVASQSKKAKKAN